jgi:arylsulfatase A-like enzyme
VAERLASWGRPAPWWRAPWLGAQAGALSAALVSGAELWLCGVGGAAWPLAWLSLAALVTPPLAAAGAVGGLAWAWLARSAGAGGRWWATRLLLFLGALGVVVWALQARFPGLWASGTGAAWGLVGLGAASWGLWMTAAGPLSLRLGRARRVARWALSRGAGAWLLLAACGAWSLGPGWAQNPLAAVGALEQAPLGALLAEATRGAADLDGDGYSALLGGGDCDDLRAEAHPGAPERPCNGVDEDCDGADDGPEALILHARLAVEGARALAATAESPPEPPSPSAWARRPILLVTLDTVRPDALGMHGASPSPSPSLDMIAGESAVFSRAYAQGPLTKASVPSVMTGRYFSELERSAEAWTRLREGNETLAELLTQAGYQTAAVTSHAYLMPRYGHGQGFGRFAGLARADGYWYADQVTARGLAEVDRLRSGASPWFLWLHYIDPHHPYVPHESLGVAAEASPRERYLAELRWTDQQVGALVEGLKARGLWGEVHVVIHSDHGESFGEHQHQHHGQALYEEQVRALLLWRGPGVKARRWEEPVMLLDLFPTLREVAAQEAAPEAPSPLPPLGRGESLWGTLQGGHRPRARPVFTEVYSDIRALHRVAVVEGRWKLIRSLKPQASWELYDLEADPGELTEASAAHPEPLAHLRLLLEAWMRDGLSPRPPR